MIWQQFVTGTAQNSPNPSFIPMGPKRLKVSQNSAFGIHRKRTRDEESDMCMSPTKLRKVTESNNSDYTISSASSVSSFTQMKGEKSLTSTKGEVSKWASPKKRDLKLRTKTKGFEPYSYLAMETRPEHYSRWLQDISNQCVRGRKRTNILKKATTIKELISELVFPEWQEYLVDKRNKENSSKYTGVRSDAVWKKIMRDWREFFRIMFKHRFHRMDYQDHDQKMKCITTLISELGFPVFEEDNVIYSFNFLHQIHLSEKNKAKYGRILSEHSCGFDALNRYTNENRTMFLEDPLCLRLLYFLYKNFREFYCSLLSTNIKEKVEECIDYVLRHSEELENDHDVIPTDSLPI